MLMQPHTYVFIYLIPEHDIGIQGRESGSGETEVVMEGKYHAEGQSCRIKGLINDGPEGCTLDSRTVKMKHRN